MATYTTNLELIKPAGTDKIRIAQINQNMDTIDNAIGAVGNTSLQAQVTAAANSLNAVEGGVAIVSNNNAHAAIASGQYVYIKNNATLTEGMYVATQSIGANGELTLSNVTPVSGGAINALQSATNQALLNKLDKSASVISSLSALKTWYSTNKIGIVRVPNTVGVLLSGRSRQGMVSGYEITSEYIGYTFLGSDGDVFSGYITTATDAVTYNQVAPILQNISDAHTWNTGAVDTSSSSNSCRVVRYGRLIKIEFQCKIKSNASADDNAILLFPAKYRRMMLARGFVCEVGKTSANGIVGYCGFDSWTQNGSVVDGVYIGAINQFAGKTILGFVEYFLQNDPYGDL